MRVWLLAVGKPGRVLGPAIAEYERRARRYWRLEVVEVREERARKGLPDSAVRQSESARLLERLPAGADLVALTRGGTDWSSHALAAYLDELALRGAAGAAFLIGGAVGLDDALLRRADHRLALSAFTLPHDLARLVMGEQLYRAGTIRRGEPYHKSRT